MRKSVATVAYFNGLLLTTLENKLTNNPNQSISDFYEEFQKNNNKDFYLGNHGQVISMLYTTLVLLKEIWESSKCKGMNFTFDFKKYFKIEKCSKKDTCTFIRGMRNALSHANFEISIEEQKYTFFDENPRNKKRHFQVSISQDDIFEFISKLANYYQQVLLKDLNEKNGW